MKTLEYQFNGQTYHLCLNGAALFDIYEKYGNKGFVTDPIRGTGKKSFSATCWMLSKLAEQGELVRRYQGYPHGKFPTEQMFAAMLRPADVRRSCCVPTPTTMAVPPETAALFPASFRAFPFESPFFRTLT